MVGYAPCCILSSGWRSKHFLLTRLAKLHRPQTDIPLRLQQLSPCVKDRRIIRFILVFLFPISLPFYLRGFTHRWKILIIHPFSTETRVMKSEMCISFQSAVTVSVRRDYMSMRRVSSDEKCGWCVSNSTGVLF